jgi:hypothetical protein
MRRYLHYLQTGSGSNRVDVQFGDEVVEVAIRMHWMGSGLKRYKLTCRHHRLSDSFGLFAVERVEAATEDDAPLEVIALNEEEMLLPLIIEYVTVPQGPVYVHEQSQLIMMRPLGYATWNDSFELVLMVYDFEGRAQEPPLSEICDVLDKKKFALWSEAMEAEQAARKRADFEKSAQMWKSILSNQGP